ncbi:MAG: Unknown protein [uncultured Thiotrichaceae bacterium]|uniref:Antitoxin n=1 Tax=uncultured Thiotrichaceae bacterium TaxID=298394 RepID=A0A6S6TI69_9GAMM|nr:MAG: Unknown protein [uncultured Thiotrichaceae bacterium]
MQQVNIHEAKTRFSRLLEKIESGEDIVITRHGKPIVRLIPFEEPAIKRKLVA